MRRSWNRCGAVLPVAVAFVLLQGCEQGSGGAAATIAGSSAALTQDAVVPTGTTCAPTGKHAEHGGFTCATCHQCAGTLSFDPTIAGPSAAFDATTKNCSNVACHAVAAGTFTYYTYDWDTDQTVATTVPYGGAQGAATANWYAPPGTTCNACHGYPPKYNGVAYVWHSGAHGLGTANGNNCSLCHPDASGAYVYGGPPSYVGTSGGLISSCDPNTYCSAPGSITNRSLHGNGSLDVSTRFVSACIGCH